MSMITKINERCYRCQCGTEMTNKKSQYKHLTTDIHRNNMKKLAESNMEEQPININFIEDEEPIIIAIEEPVVVVEEPVGETIVVSPFEKFRFPGRKIIEEPFFEIVAEALEEAIAEPVVEPVVEEEPLPERICVYCGTPEYDYCDCYYLCEKCDEKHDDCGCDYEVECEHCDDFCCHCEDNSCICPGCRFQVCYNGENLVEAPKIGYMEVARELCLLFEAIEPVVEPIIQVVGTNHQQMTELESQLTKLVMELSNKLHISNLKPTLIAIQRIGSEMGYQKWLAEICEQRKNGLKNIYLEEYKQEEMPKELSQTPGAIRERMKRERERAEMGEEEYKQQEAENRRLRREKAAEKRKIVMDQLKDCVIEHFKIPNPNIINLSYIADAKNKVQKQYLTDQLGNTKASVAEALSKVPNRGGEFAKPSTIEKALTLLKAIHDRMHIGNYNRRAASVGWDYTTFDWLVEMQDDVMAQIDTGGVVNTMKGELNACGTTCWRLSHFAEYKDQGYEAASEKYQHLALAFKEQHEEIRKDNALSDNEKKNYLTWTDVADVLENKTKKSKLTLFERAILSMYIYMPPRRVSDYQMMYIVDKSLSKNKNLGALSNTKNYLVCSVKPTGLQPESVIINKYKTDKLYGQYKHDLPDMTKDFLREYLRNNSLKDGDVLFPNLTGNEEKEFSGVISAAFKKVYDRGPSVNLLRRSFITYSMKTGKLNTTRQKELIAKHMGHNIKTQQYYYIEDESVDRVPNQSSESGKKKKNKKKKKPSVQVEEAVVEPVVPEPDTSGLRRSTRKKNKPV